MNPTDLQLVGTICFALAVLHTFVAKKIENLGHKYPEGSIPENLFHFLGEVEAVFGIWSVVFLSYFAATRGLAVYDDNHQVIGGVIGFLEDKKNVNYTEAAFVFVIMCMAGTRPVIILAEKIIGMIAKLLPGSEKMSFYVSALIVGPLLGSFMTEPAAMTVTALILLDFFFSSSDNKKFKYATLGTLFVNISIGGTLTHFAAPPVLMVATPWKWDMAFMVTHFGYKSAIAVVINTIVVAFMFRKELTGKLQMKQPHQNEMKPTWWMYIVHILFLVLVVMTAHHMVFFLGLFLFFIGFAVVTQEYQDKLKIKESLLVGFFLAGLVTLGSQQGWWLGEIITKLGDLQLFIGATSLTAITDNAALTYLGTLVEGLSDSSKYNLVAGAVAGGGLTVIANAPNPAGFGILKDSFGEEGITPLGLLKSALIPTVIACLALQLLPSL